MIAVVLVALCATITSNATWAADRPASKLGVYHLGGDSKALSTLIDSGKMHIFRPTVEHVNKLVPYYKQKNPRGIVVVGLGGGPRMEFEGDPAAFARKRWEEHIGPRLSLIRPDVLPLVDYFGVSPNMSEPKGAGQAAWWSRYAIAMSSLCQQAHIKPIIMTSGVGGLPCVTPDDHIVLEGMLPGLRAAYKAGGGWACHAYTLDYTKDLEHEGYYSLRYRKAYEFLKERAPDLLDMPMILSEAGVDKAGDPDKDGYLARGSREKYADWLCWFDREIGKDDCVVGATLFAMGAGGGWKSFDVKPMVPWLVDYWNKGSSQCPVAND